MNSDYVFISIIAVDFFFFLCICFPHLGMVQEILISFGWCQLIQRSFCMVYDYEKKKILASVTEIPNKI